MEKKMIVFPSGRNGSWFSSWNNHQDIRDLFCKKMVDYYIHNQNFLKRFTMVQHWFVNQSLIVLTWSNLTHSQHSVKARNIYSNKRRNCINNNWYHGI